MAVCTCPPEALANPECRRHGLAAGAKHPPMDAHAHPGEDAASAQRRLYQEAQGIRECVLCGRQGRRAFVLVCPLLRRFTYGHRWERWPAVPVCKNQTACRRRTARRVRHDSRHLETSRRL